MPERKRIRWAQLKVGAIALASLLILAALILLLTNSKGVFRHTVPLYTYMDDASGMTTSTPVRLNGISIGYLSQLRLTNSRDPKRTVQFEMQVDEDRLKDIPIDSVAGIAAANLLGDKFIDITKGSATETVKPGAELKALQSQDIPQLMSQMAGVLQMFQTMSNRVDNLLAGVEAGRGNIGKLLKDEELYNRLNSIASEGQKLLADVRTANGTLGRLIYDDTLYQELRAPLKRIDSMLGDLQGGQGTAGKLLKDPALYDEAQRSLAELRGLVADLNSGKGTAGKLMKDDQLYQRLDDLVARFNSTVDKIESGQGTLGQLLVNPQLYNALTGATREFQSLAQDMRANPKKFLTIRLVLF
jgi:phospholipid/cholesterol/gamma-HCH transport system substrate-binding protein